jgi:hypothetical protein
VTSPVRAENEAVVVELTGPEPGGPRELHGSVRFLGDGPATAATVSLALFAQRGEGPVVPERIEAQTLLAGCSAEVSRAAADASFAFPLPDVASPYAGKMLQIAVGVSVVPDAGGALRVVLDVPPEGAATRRILRGLPKDLPLSRPLRFSIALLVTLLGATVVVGGRLANAGWEAIGWLAVLGGVVLGASSRSDLLAWLRVGAGRVRLEAHDAEGKGDPELVVYVVAGARAAGGRARVTAIEYDVDDGRARKLADIASREVPLVRRSGGLAARVPLPPSVEAPPSLALKAGKRLLAIRWVAEVDVENRRGVVARSSVPLHVGIAPPR